MLRWKLRFVLVATLCLIPYLILMGTGCWWLYERNLLTWFAVAAAFLTVLGWNIDRLFQAKNRKAVRAAIKSLGAAGEQGTREAVETLALRVEANPPSFDDQQAWKEIAIELFDTVAVRFGRTTEKPSLEITVPDAMLIVEHVIRDLRLAAKSHLPGSHMLTIRQIEQLVYVWQGTTAITSNASPWRLGYRLIRFAMNPVSGLFKEANDNIIGELSVTALEEAKRWAIGFTIRRAGEYAIELYSGQLAMHEKEFQEFRSPKSKADAVQANEHQSNQRQEPLRIIMLGQAKAGKSSLVNALFGEVRAATDALPCTQGINPYLLEREGMPSAILFDTEGFGGKEDRRAMEQLNAELMKCDLVIMVCSATTAARASDQQLLSELRARFASNQKRAFPPIVVALSHIDQLRPFAEWNPPYDLRDQKSIKAKNISGCIQTLETDLKISGENIVPVCLRPGATHNVSESLVPIMLEVLPIAERAKLLRLLREYHDSTYWSQLLKQAYNAGRVLIGSLNRKV